MSLAIMKYMLYMLIAVFFLMFGHSLYMYQTKMEVPQDVQSLMSENEELKTQVTITVFWMKFIVLNSFFVQNRLLTKKNADF